MNKIDDNNTALLLIDWQEKLYPAMPETIRKYNLRQTVTLSWLAKERGIPIVVSEQYPLGLGCTLPELEVENAIEKVYFSAMREPVFKNKVEEIGAQSIILSGMETHICVLQTCQDLMASGYEVIVPADAVLSRKKLDWRWGLERMKDMGAKITTSESILFELLGSSKDPQFKEVSRRIR
jgi:nicotinamidase-related amidase